MGSTYSLTKTYKTCKELQKQNINSTDIFGTSIARVDGFRSQPTVNTDEDMVRVVLDMPKRAWRKLKSIIPPNASHNDGEVRDGR